MADESLIGALLRNWPAVLVVAFSAYLAGNRFNHGLNKYPGPFLASLTDWWRFWDVYKRRPEVTHIKLHEKHGDVVRLGPNALSFADPKALKAIYGLNKGFIKVPKHTPYGLSNSHADESEHSLSSIRSRCQWQAATDFRLYSAPPPNISTRNYAAA